MPETVSTRRLRWLLWLLLVWVAAIFARLISLQVLHHDELLHMAQQQQQKTEEIPAMRGTIFDRTGQPLAKTLPAESICVNPLKIPDPGVAADILSRVLDLDRASLYQRIATAKARKSGFLWVKRKVSPEEAARVHGLPSETRQDLVAAMFSEGVSTRDDATAVSGRGVGLATLQAVVRRLRGQIVVDSEPGRGARFTFVVPRSEDATQRAV